MYLDPGLLKVKRYGCGPPTSPKGTRRSDDAKKEPSVRSLWAPVLEIIDQCLRYHPRERIGSTVACLAIRDLQPFMLSVNIVDGQLSDFAGPQSVGHQQEQDGVISTATHRAPINRL